MVAEIYAGRSEELAERILAELPIFLADMDRNHSVTVFAPGVRSWFEAAYQESGETMPDETREILDRWSASSN